MIKTYLVTEYLFITEGNSYFKDFKNTLYAGVLFVHTRSSGQFHSGSHMEQPDLLCTVLALNIELLSIIVCAVL
jgi:hypothetical protein